MSRGIRATLTMLMVMSAVSSAQAQHHESKPAQAHAAPPAAEKPAGKAAGHDTKAPAKKPTADAHGTKPAAPAAEHAAAAPPAKAAAKAPAKASAQTPAASSVQHAVARVMDALDRELGKPGAASPRPHRSTPTKPGANKIAVSWRTQLAWPEADVPANAVRLQWPDPVLASVPLRLSYVGLPK